MNRQDLQKIAFLVSFWVFVALFITFYDSAVILFDPAVDYPLQEKEYNLFRILGITLIATVIGGILIASIEVLYFDKLLRKKAFGVSLLIKAVFYLFNILFFTSLSQIALNYFHYDKSLTYDDVMETYATFFTSPRSLSMWIFWGMSVMLALFILQIGQKLGQGVLVNYILGKYHRPREESRIFMFLDLKSSTSHAEKLGHIKYSRLIQDCFYDLTDVVTKYQAQIYQYVGDEVILTWKINVGLRNLNCINIYFDYLNVLRKRKDYYEKKYKLMPEFKAGLDSGTVTVAEVGEIKKELAYHGDVLNTAARIQGMCNQFKTGILLSERLKTRIGNDQSIGFERIGNIDIRGKEIPMNIYKITDYKYSIS